MVPVHSPLSPDDASGASFAAAKALVASQLEGIDPRHNLALLPLGSSPRETGTGADLPRWSFVPRAILRRRSRAQPSSSLHYPTILQKRETAHEKTYKHNSNSEPMAADAVCGTKSEHRHPSPPNPFRNSNTHRMYPKSTATASASQEPTVRGCKAHNRRLLAPSQ